MRASSSGSVPAGFAFHHLQLDLDRAFHRIDDAGEFDQHAVAHKLDNTPVVLGDLRVDQLLAMRLLARNRALLVGFHEARVAYYVGGEDCCKSASDLILCHLASTHGTKSVDDSVKWGLAPIHCLVPPPGAAPNPIVSSECQNVC